MLEKSISQFTDYAWGITPGVAGRGVADRSLFVEDGCAVAEATLVDLLDNSGGVLLATADVLQVRPVRRGDCVSVTGSLGFPGDELVIAEEVGVETVAYAEANYVAMDGPIYAAIADERDAIALAEDCECFAADGRLPVGLSSKNFLFEAGGLLGNCLCEGARRVTARSNGQYSSSIVGRETEGVSKLPVAGVSGVCPSCIQVSFDKPVLVHLSVAAALVMRRLAEPWERVSVSGAGGFFDPTVSDHASAEYPHFDVVVMRDEDTCLALNTATMGVFRASPTAAALLEWATWCEPDVAIDRVGARFQLSHLEAKAALDRVLVAAGVAEGLERVRRCCGAGD